MIETATILIAAHMAGDFPLQPAWMVERKRAWRVLLAHVALVLLAVVLLLGAFCWTTHWPTYGAILGITAVSHLVIDAGKLRLPTGKWWSDHGLFTIDQELHIAVAVVLAACFPSAASGGYWISQLPSDAARWYLAGLTAISGLILCVPVSGAFIGMLTKQFRDQIETTSGNSHELPQDNGEDGIENGGTYIGWLERGLVFLLVMIQQPAGIGFLIAAKSILRFGDIRDAHRRRMTEYVIIGTLLSFGWAILFSALTYAALQYWK